MTDHKSIQEAMLAIYNEVGYVQKERSDNLNYTFASEKEFIKTLRPVMINNGVTVFVKSMNNIIQTEYTTRSGAVMLRTNIHGVVCFTHVTGSFIDVESYGEGADSGDKSTNKAMTDLYKYALRQTFMIETGDDPDKDASEPGTGTPAKASGKPATPQKVDVPDKVTNQEYYTLTRVTMKMSLEDSNDFLAKHNGSFEQAYLAAKAQLETK
jgi:hypothetical protein